jgi:prepilin-type N-terminal cleavage/methylation domain-containing protein
MLTISKKQSGFTLIEIAIVLLIVAILLGYTVAMFPIQQELKQYREANSEMDEIVDALIAFAQVNGRLPCPDTTGDINGTGASVPYDGLEDTDDLLLNDTGAAGNDSLVDNCKSFFGFLPSATLGMDGDKNDLNQLQDPWGNAYGYAVSNINADADADPTTAAARDLVSPNGIREEGLTNVIPDLFICDDSAVTGATDKDCDDVTGSPVVNNVAAVVISLGKSNDLGATSNIQIENFDDFNDGRNDKVYISTTRSDAAGAEFDDVVRWISPNLLFSKMIEADQLP